MLHRFLIALTAVALLAGPSAAQMSDGIIKIGVLNDQSSLYSDLAGQGSVVAARMAVEDYGAAAKGLKLKLTVEVTPEGGISKQKFEETKASLRELGMNDDLSST